MKAQRCPALTITLIEDKQVKETARCEKAIGHRGGHLAGARRWRFERYSYHGLSEDHPEYNDTVDIVAR